MIKIGFITGARSEYGIMKPVIRSIAKDSRFDVSIIATGMHYLNQYGHTIDEIYNDGLAIVIDAPCYREKCTSKKDDFVALINVLYNVLFGKTYDVVYLIGDRLEAYASALVAHFLKIPIVHYAGGQITEGAVDNIYRYNISNLATIHLVTNIFAEERLAQSPIVDSSNVFIVGSSAIDAINEYLKKPQDASIIDTHLRRGNYVLMTFHSETNSNQSCCSISEMMDVAIEDIVSNNEYVLITYPNNDDGVDKILSIIHKWENNPYVIVRKNLGALKYYIAVDNAKYVIGNSSSAIIEVPYFQKYSVDVGSRQQGRNHPMSVIHINNDSTELKRTLNQLRKDDRCLCAQEYIYGKGNSLSLIPDIVKKTVPPPITAFKTR